MDIKDEFTIQCTAHFAGLPATDSSEPVCRWADLVDKREESTTQQPVHLAGLPATDSSYLVCCWADLVDKENMAQL